MADSSSPAPSCTANSCTAASQQQKDGPSVHDTNLINVLFTSALDGEFVRDQISGSYKPYAEAEDSAASVTAQNKEQYAIDDALLASLKERERQAIKIAENDGDIAGAIKALSAVIDDCPHYSSAYNNRAQAYRLEGKEAEALDDLDSAIRYAQSDDTLGQAYTQKAIILRAKGDQDGAFYCFSQGAKYGNEVAKMAAAKENPYAKLCGKIVSESMRQLRNPTLPA